MYMYFCNTFDNQTCNCITRSGTQCIFEIIIKKRCCYKDTDKFSVFATMQSMAHKSTDSQTIVCSRIEYYEETALCKKSLLRILAFCQQVCEPRLPRIFFHVIVADMKHVNNTCFIFISESYQDTFCPAKLRYFFSVFILGF